MTSPLTVQQRSVLQLTANGMTAPQVARQLWVSVDTVKFHLATIRDLLGARNTTHAVAKAWRAGIIE